MSAGSWRCVSYAVVFSFVLVLLDTRTDATLEGSSMGYLSLPDSQQPAAFSGVVRVSDVRVSHEGHEVISRRKRNILFSSGVKLCAQETSEQVLAHHLSYFHLRVCQETIWEAYKIFWDRLPEQDEYQSWMNQCQEGTVTAQDFGIYFSQSEEHRELVKKRMSQTAVKSEPSRPWNHMCSSPTLDTLEATEATEAPEVPEVPEAAEVPEVPEIPEVPEVPEVPETPEVPEVPETPEVPEAPEVPEVPEVPETTEVPEVPEAPEIPEVPEVPEMPELEDAAGGREEAAEAEEAAVTFPDVEENSLNNDIAMEPSTPAVLEQVVELSIHLTGEMYSDSLDDPASLQYQTLSRQFAEKIEDALEGLPGFKSVSVLDFRPQKDNQGLDGVVVDYAVTVVVNGAGVSNEQLDYLTLQLNRVENSYREVMERPTVIYSISEVKDFGTEALHKTELESESEVPDSVSITDGEADTAVDEPQEMVIIEDDVLPELSETVTVAAEETSNIVILEESTLVSPAPVLPSTGPEAIGLEEEGLLLEDTVQTPAVENHPAEELPAEPPVPELPEVVTLPEPPVEVEASGAGTVDLEDLLRPSTPTAAVEEDVGEKEETVPEDELMTREVTSEDEIEKVEVAVVAEEPTAAAVDEEHVDEVVVDEAEVPKEPEEGEQEVEEVSEDLPALVPSPEVVDTAAEAPEPEAAEALLPVDEELVEDTEESNLTDIPPADEEATAVLTAADEDFNVVLTSPDDLVFEEGGMEVPAETEEQELQEDIIPEVPAVEEVPEAPEISTEDLTEDEILLVDADEAETPMTYFVSPAQPTALSPERESPFTRIADISPASEGHPDIFIPTLVEVETTNGVTDDTTIGDQGFSVVHFGYGLINHTEEGSTDFPLGVAHGTDQASIAMPVNPGRALMVFFSLRVTNMIFSDDLFNKSSPEYKALEQRFLELLVPYLQSNLSNFENLEILNFRNGSIVVNSRMKFGKPVQQGVTTTVYLILEDFCNTAYQTMNLAIDKYSLDVESGDQADPCKFQACNEYAECKVNKWSGEAECVCNAGYFSMDGLPCQSICELKTDFCLNDGKCDIIPGQGAICRCRVGENWWYRGEHCEEYVSEPLVVGIAIASVAGFLLVASGVIFFLARTLRDQYDKDESEDPIRRAESLPSLERATKYNPMYESEATTGYSHYYRRYPEAPAYSSASAEASTDFSSEEIRHIYENSELTKEEIQDRIRIIELYAKDRQFADFVRQHQAVLDTRRESSST